VALHPPSRAGGAGVGLAERGEDGLRPGPADLGAELLRKLGRVTVERQVAAGGEVAEQVGGEFRQQGGGGFVVRRWVAVERDGKAARRGRGGMRRAAEGEEFQQVARRDGRQAEALERGGGVDQQGRRAFAQAAPDLGGGEREQLAIRRQQCATPEAGDQRRRLGEEKARLASRNGGAGLGHGSNLARMSEGTKGEGGSG
jgi:hypothetical protein